MGVMVDVRVETERSRCAPAAMITAAAVNAKPQLQSHTLGVAQQAPPSPGPAPSASEEGNRTYESAQYT